MNVDLHDPRHPSPRTPRRARMVGVLALIVGLLAPLAASTAPAAAATTLPGAPSVTLSPTSVATTLQVSWTPADDQAAKFAIYAYDETGPLAQAVCFDAGCRSKLLPGLAPGHQYQVLVAGGNSAGWGPTGSSQWVTVRSGCGTSTGMCGTVDGTTPAGSELHPAQGFLMASMSNADVAALQPRWWRVMAAPGGFDMFDRARASGAKVIVLMSDTWRLQTWDDTRGGAQPMWQDWSQYRTWVHDYVAGFLAAGRKPDYWEVQNEPGVAGFLSPADTAAWTPDLQLEQWRIAYEEIKALDPAANVIGPTIDTYSTTPGLYGNPVDLRTFLDYTVANNLHPAALAWHELQASKARMDFTVLPIDITMHVQEVRQLLAQRNMNDVGILIDEYGAPETHTSPGWTVGHMDALEAADVDGANRTCWDAISIAGVQYNECTRGLDGLYDGDNVTTLGNYWVHKFYAAMTGTRVATTTSTAKLSVLAADDQSGVVRALVGRHEQCSLEVTRDCGKRLPTEPLPVPVDLVVKVPGKVSKVQVTVNRIPGDGGPLPAPVPVIDAKQSIVNGRVLVSLSGVLDGEAYTVTVAPVR